jgi:hypothetical protein
MTSHSDSGPGVSLDDLPDLRLHLKRATDYHMEEFSFRTREGETVELYTPYAKYLVQYLETIAKQNS